MPVYAADTFYWNGIEVQDYNDESIILPENVKESRGIVRGSILSTGIVDISNGGKGKVELTIQTLAHVRCDRICNALTLQVWNESLGDWQQVERFEFEAEELFAVACCHEIDHLNGILFREHVVRMVAEDGHTLP